MDAGEELRMSDGREERVEREQRIEQEKLQERESPRERNDVDEWEPERVGFAVKSARKPFSLRTDLGHSPRHEFSQISGNHAIDSVEQPAE